MKKYLSLFLSVLLAFTLVGCGDPPNTTVKSNSSNNNANDKPVSENKEETTTFEETITSSGINSTTTNKNVRLYYYNGATDKIVYKDTTVEVKDGALVTAIIEGLKVNYGDDYCALNSNISVKNAKLDKENDLLTVNFGNTFINNMNLGSGAESAVLQSIVNSLGYNFDVSNIYITVDDNPYSSGHILLEKDETIAVKYNNISSM